MRWPTRYSLPACLALALAAAAVAVGLSTGSSVHAAPPPRPSDYFGMNAQYVFKLPPDQWDRQLAAIASLGVGVVREDAFWSRVEKSAPGNGTHRYSWDVPDAIAAALARNGLRWYPILDYSTPWAGTLSGAKGWKSAPADPADFAAYAAAFADRYGSNGSFWAANPALPALPVQSYEIWNEPNLADFWPDTRGAALRYGELLAAAAPAIRAADPPDRWCLEASPRPASSNSSMKSKPATPGSSPRWTPSLSIPMALPSPAPAPGSGSYANGSTSTGRRHCRSR